MITSQLSLRVRYAETDQMGFVYHGAYLPWLEQARIHLLDTVGVPYRELEEAGFLLPVLEAHLTYLRPARFDDRISVEARMDPQTGVRIQIGYTVSRAETVLCEGYTRHAFINRAGQPIRPPSRLVEALRKAAPSPEPPFLDPSTPC
ncbi:MAG: acyl-CoA thioesterase [Puniceicoccaceae bacterium]